MQSVRFRTQAALLDFLFLTRLTAPMDMILPSLGSCSTRCEKFIGELQVLTLFLKGRWKGKVIGFRCWGLRDEFQPIAFHDRADKNLARWVQGLRSAEHKTMGRRNHTRCLFF